MRHSTTSNTIWNNTAATRLLSIVLLLVVATTTFAAAEPAQTLLLGTKFIVEDIRDIFLDPCRAYETGTLSQLVYLFNATTEELTGVIPSTVFQNNSWIDQGSTEVLISKKTAHGDGNADYQSIPPGSAVVTFRGSEETADWIVNVDQVKVPFGFPNHIVDYEMYQVAPDGKSLEAHPIEVHRGFNQMFRIYDDIVERIAQLDLAPDASLHVTGHSLGGANALLFAVHYAYSHPLRPVHVTTFGAPRVGTRGFKLLAEQLKNLNIWRTVNSNDIVPRIPYDGFEHAGHLYWNQPISTSETEEDTSTATTTTTTTARAYYRQIGDLSRGWKGVKDFSLAAFQSIQTKGDNNNDKDSENYQVRQWIGDHMTSQYRSWWESACLLWLDRISTSNNEKNSTMTTGSYERSTTTAPGS